MQRVWRKCLSPYPISVSPVGKNKCLSHSGPVKEGQRIQYLALGFLPGRLSYSDRIGMRICHYPKGLVLLLLCCIRSPLSWMGSNKKGKMTLHLGRKWNDSCAFFKWGQSLKAWGCSQCPYKLSSEEPAPISHLQHCQVEKMGFTDCKTGSKRCLSSDPCIELKTWSTHARLLGSTPLLSMQSLLYHSCSCRAQSLPEEQKHVRAFLFLNLTGTSEKISAIYTSIDTHFISFV